jgi:hypothetical protein
LGTIPRVADDVTQWRILCAKKYGNSSSEWELVYVQGSIPCHSLYREHNSVLSFLRLNDERIEKMPTFEIPEANLYGLEDKIEKLNRKAAKLGTGQITFQVGDFEMRKRKDDTPVKIYTVTVDGQAPKMNGWRFVAKIEHLDIGNVIHGYEDVPEQFRNTTPICEHCGLKRKRSNTFVVANTENEYKQVGSSCVADFTGHADPETVAKMAEYIWTAIQEATENVYDPDGFYHSPYIRLTQYLAYTAMAIRNFGFVSKSKVMFGQAPTANIAFSLMNKKGANHESPSAKDEDVANDTVDWVRAIEDTTGNDYLYNLTVIFSDDYMHEKHAGYTASAIVAMQKAQAHARELEIDGVSEYQGTIKKRQEWTLKLISVKTIEGMYGATHIHRFKDENGNVFVWFSSREELNPGYTFTGKGTVKDHKEYRNIKQTILTRCKFEAID